jgi:hypothetical protein
VREVSKSAAGVKESNQHTSSVDSIRCPEHTVLFRDFTQFSLGGKVLPFALPCFELLARLHLSRDFGRARRPIADFAGLLSGLAGEGGIDVCRGGDDVGIGWWGWKGWGSWRTISFAFFGFPSDRFDVFC